MKKIQRSCLIILFLMAMNSSYGLIENRLQWWEVRLDKLIAERAWVQKNRALDQQVTVLVDNEMSRARDMIATYKEGAAAERPHNNPRESQYEKIARIDVDMLCRHIAECIEMHEKFRYGEDAVYRFAERFAAFLKESRAGTVSPALGKAVKMNSILFSLENFDRDRLNRETATRKFILKEAQAGLSRLQTLRQAFKKNGIEIKDVPLMKEIAEQVKRLGSGPRVKIDSWAANEANITEIDKKAVKRLSLIINRRAAETGINVAIEKTKIISVQNPGFSLSIPPEWEEDSVGEMESYKGILKSFHMDDGNSSIKLVRLLLDGVDIEKAAEDWIQKAGYSLVEKRRGTAHERRSLWILAKDKSKNISETLSISKDGYALLITGSASRDRYAKFKIQFRKIVNSLQADKM